MANVNRPTGLSPARSILSPWMGQTNRYWIPASDTNAYYIGDAVASLAGSDANGVPRITKAVTQTNTPLRGVISATEFDPTNLNTLIVPATKLHDYYVDVVDDPNALFEVTDDGITTGNLTNTTIGKNCQLTVAAPSGVVPVSATVIYSASIADTQALPIKIIGLAPGINNTPAPFAVWLVKINQHELAGNTAGT